LSCSLYRAFYFRKKKANIKETGKEGAGRMDEVE
jgi:hypothetical protein